MTYRLVNIHTKSFITESVISDIATKSHIRNASVLLQKSVSVYTSVFKAKSLSYSTEETASSPSNPPSKEALKLLKQFYGYSSFRHVQWEIIRCVTEDRCDFCRPDETLLPGFYYTFTIYTYIFIYNFK